MDAQTYRSRRDGLRQAIGSGLAFLPGNRLQPRNYRDNVFPFRQSSHVLYYSGIERPGVTLIISSDGADMLFGTPEDIDDIIWHGPHATLEDEAAAAGIATVRDVAGLQEVLRVAGSNGARVHWLPPYQAEVHQWMAEILVEGLEGVQRGVSRDLVRAVARQRSIKSDDEVAQIEDALEITSEMHLEAMRMVRPGLLESEIAAAVQRIALAKDRAQAYNPIVSVRGEVLHNESYRNRLEEGQLLLNDSGCESPLRYAGDITRTFPVSGRFAQAQRDIYDVVLDAQLSAIDAVRPGVSFKEVHLIASRCIAVGLGELGLMKGDPDEAVAAGAHALFFPHGLGHMLGLDVHDMEDLGDEVGYGGEGLRSEQFGLNFLRLARPLEPGFVLTIEPGIYFIPALIERWRAEGTGADFIDFERAWELRGLGGIRTEDDVLCTTDGGRVLGPGIPKTADEIEAVMS